MAQHQPGVRTQHRDVIGDGLGVGRPHADVDHGDAAAAAGSQVIGGHLRHAARRDPGGAAAEALVGGDQVPRLDETVVVGVAGGHVLLGDAAELVDVERVVGEDHEVLEVPGFGAGVVAEPVQRIVDPRRGERGQRVGPADRRDEGAVGDLIVGVGKVGRIEDVAQRDAKAVEDLPVERLVLVDGEMQRDRGRRFAHLDGPAVVLQDDGEVVDQVVLEQLGRGQRRAVGAGAMQEAVGQGRIGLPVAGRGDLNLGVEGADLALGDDAPGQFGQPVTDEAGVAAVDFRRVLVGAFGIGESLLGKRIGTNGGQLLSLCNAGACWPGFAATP